MYYLYSNTNGVQWTDESNKGKFTTNTNTYTVNNYKYAAESDMMKLEYQDPEKWNKYGANIADSQKDMIWKFDCFHTGLTSTTQNVMGNILITEDDCKTVGIPTGDDFVPNSVLNATALGDETINKLLIMEGKIACNIANYGVTNRYHITITNNSSITTRYFKYIASGEGQQVVRYKKNDGTFKNYKFKICDVGKDTVDDEFAEEFLNEPIEPNETVEFIIEITMLTGCNGTIHNFFQII